MTLQDFIDSHKLGAVILSLLSINKDFKEFFKTVAVDISADVESAADNPNCSCRSKVQNYVTMYKTDTGTALYNFASEANILTNVISLFDTIQVNPTIENSISGRVAKTTIKDWPDFAKTIINADAFFRGFSTSIIGDDVYVFFL